ncbi:hypothetical protein ACEQ8H_002266 [Pleosporales sp. CAS-2024a]
MHASTLLPLLAGATLAVPHKQARAVQCPIVFDGRVPVNTALTYFDTNNALFNPDYVKGNNLAWSSILKLPNETASRFDGSDYTALEVTISDKSIFQQQYGFRRAGLQFAQDSSSGPGATGVKTLHFSVKQDATRPLNLTHEYLNAWHETADYSADQIMFQTGSLIGKSDSDKASFKILDRSGTYLYAVPIDYQNWQNFAITLNYNNNSVNIYYSVGSAELKAVASNKSANLAGGGQYQLGILKKPTGTSDVVNSGYQEPNLNEAQIYGGVFLEDSSSGCVSL